MYQFNSLFFFAFTASAANINRRQAPSPSLSSSSTPAAIPTPSPSASSAATPPATDPGSTNTTGTGTGTGGAGGCPADYKGVVFNANYNAGQFDTIGSADHWLTFGLSIAGTPTAKDTSGHIPMMAFASDVPSAVAMVNPTDGSQPPTWMLTFNEPDLPYPGNPPSPTMSPQEASDAIQPLLKNPGKGTQYVAPVTADPTSDWLPQFYTACGCQSFFSAYNIHIYQPTVQGVYDEITAFHTKFGDKHIWVTEIAPNAGDVGFAATFMQQIYSWTHAQGWVDRVFWNSGNWLQDANIINSCLLDAGSNPTALLGTYAGLSCSGATS